MEEKDPKRKAICIDATGLTLIESVKKQMKELHDFLEAEMPEHGWMYNKGVCCYYDKMPKVFAEASSLGVQLDLDRWQKETTMFLVITTIHPTIDVGHTMYLCNGNKKTLLDWLSDEDHVQEVTDCILKMSKAMKEKGDYGWG